MVFKRVPSHTFETLSLMKNLSRTAQERLRTPQEFTHGRPPWGIQGIHGYPKLLYQYASLYADLCACCFMSQNFSVLAQTIWKWWPFKVKV
jgi:hypothetical protein